MPVRQKRNGVPWIEVQKRDFPSAGQILTELDIIPVANES
jgi:hypothetical protein